MGKKVTVITSSLRNGSNSDILAQAFADGARDAGNEVNVISLKNKNIRFCIGCLACQASGKCVMQDDVAEIMAEVKESDVLAFASPVYYYSISGQLKTLLDRLNPLFADEYRFCDIYFLSVAHEDETTTVEGAETAIQGWVDCFSEARLVKTFFAGGVGAPREIKDHKALQQAYETGKSI